MFNPAYSKDFFSGGVLSSQRSESTNNSLRRRLTYTQGLCEFYKVFVDVVDEWREKENNDNHKSRTGNKYLAFAEVPLLVHAREVYTVAIYCIFEDNYIKSVGCHYSRLKSTKAPFIQFHVRRPKKDLIAHTVSFNPTDYSIECTCKYFSEMGLLCFHSLRIYNVFNVDRIPNKYIVGRWTKKDMCTRVHDVRDTDASIVQASVWRVQTVRNFNGIINACQHDTTARTVVDTAFNELKDKVESLTGKLEESFTIQEFEDMSTQKIKDPPKKRKKGTKDERLKSIAEKERNKVKGWKKRTEKATTKNKIKAQESVKVNVYFFFNS